jgi:hypothetical protein
VGEELGFLREVAFDFDAQRRFPRAADHDVEDNGGGNDDDEKSCQQLEETTVSHGLLNSSLLRIAAAYFGDSKR